MAEVKPAGKPIWPKAPAGFVRAVLAGHSALGLAFAALIYLVCFSGTVAVFVHDLERWERPGGPVLGEIAPTSVQAAARAAIDADGRAVEHVFITLPTSQTPRLELVTDLKGEQRRWLGDTAGRIMESPEPVWTTFMVALHTRLHLPVTWGEILVGLTGVALLSSLVSGLLSHPRVFRDAFHLRWGGSKRLQEADLHNRLGVWALPFHVVISLTGAFIGLTTLIVGVLALVVFQGNIDKAYDLFLPPQPIEDARPGPMPDIVAAMAAAQRLSPGSTPTYVGLDHPLERGQGVRVNVAPPNRLSSSDSHDFDGQGRPLDPSRRAPTVGETILAATSPLHFGWFGGGLVRIAYGLLGLALCAVTSSGVAIWLARRRDKGRPAPHWERVWIATIWSQPVAYALSALAVMALGPTATVATALAVWGGGTLGVLALSPRFSPKGLSLGLRSAAAGLLVLTAVANAVRAGGEADPMAWIVDGVLLALAVLLTLSVRRTAKSRAS